MLFVSRLLGVALFSMTLCCSAEETDISIDFSKDKIPDGMKIHQTWKIQDGKLQTPAKENFSQLEVSGKNWYRYDVSFSCGIAAVYGKGGHFGLRFKSAGGGDAMLYCTGNAAKLLVNNLKKHFAVGNIVPPLPVGKDAAHFRFRVSVDGARLTLFVNGTETGSCDYLPVATDGIVLYAYNNELSIDDLEIKVYKTASAAAAAPASPNIALNSSFEETSLDALPDYWGVLHWGIGSSYWILNRRLWLHSFRTDDSQAWHGKRSMRIENPKEGPADRELTLTSCNFGMKTGGTYTLSAWMKSSPDGMKLKMGTTDGNREEVTLTGQWRRYSYTFSRTTNSLYGDMLRFQPMSGGTVWIDAVQLEPGGTATDFLPCSGDRKPIVHEGNAEKEIFDVPVLKPVFSKENIHLDGRLDEAVWKSVPSVPFQSLMGKPVQESTDFKIFCSDEGLYLGLAAREENLEKSACTMKKDGSYVWRDSSFEIFLDSKLTRGTYHHLAFNLDGFRYGADMGIPWEGQWQVATRREKDGWTAEVFIPFSDLRIDHTNGPIWGFNIGRNNRTLKETSCWAPTYAGFHTPLRFGYLEIPEKIQKKYLAGVSDVSLLPITPDTGEFEIHLVNKTGLPGPLEFRGTFFFNGQKAEMPPIRETVDFKGKTELELSSGVRKIVPDGKYALHCELLRDGNVIHRAIYQADAIPLFNMLTDRNYYSSEKNMRLRFKVNLSQTQWKQALIRCAFLSEGKTIRTESFDVPDSTFDRNIALSGWKNGLYTVNAELSLQGKKIAEHHGQFRKLPFQKNEVKLDRFRRCMLIGGKPFLPTGFFWESPDLTPELIEYLAANGVNFLHIYQPDVLRARPEVLKAAERCGIRFQINVDGRKNLHKTRIPEFKDLPATASWYPFGERFTEPQGQADPPEVYKVIEECRELDPHHPVVSLENAPGLGYVLAKKLPFPGDIPMIDHYVYPPQTNVQCHDTYAKIIMRLGEETGAPGWYGPFASGYAFHASRDPLPREHEFTFYCCLINGIRGFLYWGDHPKSETSFRKLAELFGEARVLNDALFSEEKAPSFSCNTPAILFDVRKVGSDVYLLAVNRSNLPADARFDAGAVGGKQAEVLFEKRDLPIKDHVLADRFEPLQRHVYRIPQR